MVLLCIKRTKVLKFCVARSVWWKTKILRTDVLISIHLYIVIEVWITGRWLAYIDIQTGLFKLRIAYSSVLSNNI